MGTRGSLIAKLSGVHGIDETVAAHILNLRYDEGPEGAVIEDSFCAAVITAVCRRPHCYKETSPRPAVGSHQEMYVCRFART